MRTKLCLLFALLLLTQAWGQLKINPDEIREAHTHSAHYKNKFYKKMLSGASLISPNQKMYDVHFYGLNLEMLPETKTVTGRIEIKGKITGDKLSEIELNLISDMKVSTVETDSGSLDFTHSGDIITVSLPGEFVQGQEFSIAVEYSGSPSQSGFGAFDFTTVRGETMIWSLSEPYGARNWWPCKDYPSDKADSVDINVTVPANLIVASNGNLAEVVDNGATKTYRWQERYPIVTYLVSVAIYPYRVYSDWFKYSETDSMEIQFYVFPHNYAASFDDYALTKDMLAALSDMYGLYPFINEKYGHAEFVWGGGMEHQTITSLGGWSEWLIVHELSHQWWGDMVTCDSFHHIWLNEGFASYSEALWAEYTYGKEWLPNYMTYMQYFGSGTVFVENPERDDIFSTDLSYNKAAWVLHMLRHVIGDGNFFNLLKTYGSHEQHRFGTATTEQFQALAEEVSGQDLSTFFQQWIYDEGYPEYAYSWRTRENENGKFVVTGGITQTQTMGPIFKMPVDVTLEFAESETTFVVDVNEKTENFSFEVEEAPINLVIDKNLWILRRVTEITEPLLTVSGSEIEDSEFNQNNIIDPGEQVKLKITLENLGSDLSGVTGILSTDNPQVYISSDQSGFSEIEPGILFQNDQEFIVEVLTATLPHTAEFSLILSSDQNYRETLKIYLPIGNSAILLVDDDKNEDYERYFKSMASQKHQPVDVWETAQNGVPGDTLNSYDMVFWFTGNDDETSLTSDEQQAIQSYLAQGGRLALSGANIGTDLVENGTEADSLFFTQVLHASHISGNADATILRGIGSSSITGGLTLHFEGDYNSARNQTSPGIIAPLDEAAAILQYLPNRETAALQYANPENDSRLVYYAFGLEGVSGPREETAATLFRNTIIWLSGFNSAASVPNNFANDKPETFRLHANYPNPFNPETHIKYEIAQQTHVSLKIFNMLGQEVRTLVSSPKAPGIYQTTWDGLDNAGNAMSSGVYLIQLKTANFMQTGKMILMK